MSAVPPQALAGLREQLRALQLTQQGSPLGYQQPIEAPRLAELIRETEQLIKNLEAGHAPTRP